MPETGRRALVTGVTGYLGSRLTPVLLRQGWRVRTLARDADRVTARDWGGELEVVEGDARRPEDLDRACADVDVAYYLLHSMGGGDDFARRDRELAWHFTHAAPEAGVGRIVYVSGLHPHGEGLSDHLGSRVEVGELLLGSGVPTAVLQAAVIVGAGSASFEMLRHVTHHLPAVVGPTWLDNRIQPIAVRDMLRYLVAAADLPPEVSRAFDVGGPDVLTYRGMIAAFAEAAGLPRRPVITLPLLTPALAGQWVGLVTRVPTGVAGPLVGSLLHEVVRKEHDLDVLCPSAASAQLGFDEAVRAALAGDDVDLPEPGSADPAVLHAGDATWAGLRDAVRAVPDR